ncbi:MAG: cytochrome c3 family protein, partial [Phycisphaerae bacterium]|nr:cytochrome c3 family protein [Phycisphaerae bacterium]
SENGCGDCHVPHRALKSTDPNASWGVPLWSPAQTSDGLPTFTLYSSPTFNALSTGITQPDGASKLCLGCHDGTYTGVSAAHMFGAGKAMTLSESHPISFRYDTALANSPSLHVAGELKDPSSSPSNVSASGTIATDLLDDHGKMQCTSCHDVHSSAKDTTMALRFDNTTSTMCLTCHNK